MTNDLRLITEHCVTEHRTVLQLSQLSSSTHHVHDDVGWNLNLSRIRNSINPKSYIHNTGTCPDTDFLKCASPRTENSFGSWHFLQVQKVAWPWSWNWKISCIALISDRHLLPPTLCIYPAPSTDHGRCNHHEPTACQIGGRVKLPREQKLTC